MKVDIRRLDPWEDGHLLEEAFGWLVTSPSWRKQTEAVFGTLNWDDYLANAHDPGRVDIGIWVDGNFTAIVTLTIRAKNVYEVHFEAASSTPPEAVITAGQLIRDQLFGKYNAELAYTWTPKWNRGVLAIDKAIGFQPSNVTMLHGTCRGRLIEWVHLELRANYGQREADTDPEHHTDSEPGVQQHQHVRLDDAA